MYIRSLKLFTCFGIHMLQICQMKAVRCANVLVLLVCCSLKQLVWGSRQKQKRVLNSSKKGRRGQLVHIEVGPAAAGGTDRPVAVSAKP